MSEVTMTLYEALQKKKILEDQVSKIQSYRLVDIKKKNESVNTDNLALEDIDNAINSGYASSIARINNLAVLKAAINQANASVKIVVNGKEYTMAESISRMRSIDVEERMYKRMLMNVQDCKNKIEQNRNRYLTPDAISAYVSKILGDSKKDDTLIASVTEDYKKKYELELYDPLNTEEMATNKLEDIAAFREAIHFAQTQANCTNSITVTFED